MANNNSQLLFEIVVALLALFFIGWLIVRLLEWFDKDKREFSVRQEDKGCTTGCGGCGCGCLIFIGVIAIGYFFYLFFF